MYDVVEAAGLEADHVSLQQSHPHAVPSPFPCPCGGRAAWPPSTELGAPQVLSQSPLLSLAVGLSIRLSCCLLRR